ncbi:hypothetical protein OSB04_006265 [Centaurea solstitialis]|uniref:Knottins-like domain-containing protein n=1 Tax=Centaurea solstitialis TaxID=347529 RepID=A0AA38THL2_9ASTR|nr:hypothetical protein OSB04_006265 [Centaurea solstitialis]
MAKISLVFFLLFFILAISEFTTVKGRVCETPSKTWFGKCTDTKRCDEQCIEWEDAKHGACHERESQFMCYCYYDCGPKTKPTPPPPPGDKPPEGRQPPPAEPGVSRVDATSSALSRTHP